MFRTERTRSAFIFALGAAAATALGSDLADAHFRLVQPANWVMQNTAGDPQKTGPCGNESPQTPSNVTTAFRPGDTITIQINETVYHPGHYRVALAVNSPTELPAPPAVTAGTTACGSAAIQQTPTFPVLADGMLPHTAPFTGQQQFQVKLPTDVTCTSCTLQILEFMSEHAAPCFYYHCAKISIQADGGAGPSDGGARDAAGGAGGSGATGGAAGAGATGGAGGAGATGGSGGTGATGGAGASGGSTGTGGAGGAGATGGATGTGGAGTGATGGASGTGATGGAGPGGAAGAGGSAMTGGMGGATGGGDSDNSAVTGGCSCSVVGHETRSIAGLGALLALTLAKVGRRRRHR